MDHELDAPPWRRIDGTLMSTATAIRSVYDSSLAEIGLTFPEAVLLSYVAENEGLTQIRIAAGMGSGRAITGSRIDALQAKGALERRPEPTDRRAWTVHLTTRGRDLVTEVDRIDTRLRAQLRAGISRQDRQILAELLNRIRANVADVAALTPASERVLPADPRATEPGPDPAVRSA